MSNNSKNAEWMSVNSALAIWKEETDKFLEHTVPLSIMGSWAKSKEEA
jgi:hypothetical protein